MSDFDWVDDDTGVSQTLYIDGEETTLVSTKRVVGQYNQWMLKHGKQTVYHFQHLVSSDEVVREQLQSIIESTAEQLALTGE